MMAHALYTIGYEKARLADVVATLAARRRHDADRRARPADLAPARLFEAPARGRDRGGGDALCCVCRRSAPRPRAAKPTGDGNGSAFGGLSSEKLATAEAELALQQAAAVAQEGAELPPLL